MVKIIAVVVIGIIAFVGVGIVMEANKQPPLPAATHITPPAGVERLPSEFTAEFVLAVGTGSVPMPALGQAASTAAIGIGIGTATPSASSGPTDVIGEWIPKNGYSGEVKGVKRVGDITRVSIELSTMMNTPIWVIGNIPGDPGDIKPGMNATLDGWVSTVTATENYTIEGDVIELNDASVIRSY